MTGGRIFPDAVQNSFDLADIAAYGYSRFVKGIGYILHFIFFSKYYTAGKISGAELDYCLLYPVNRTGNAVCKNKEYYADHNSSDNNRQQKNYNNIRSEVLSGVFNDFSGFCYYFMLLQKAACSDFCGFS